MASIHKILSLYCLLYIGLFRSAALGISTIAGWFRCFAFKAIYLRSWIYIYLFNYLNKKIRTCGWSDSGEDHYDDNDDEELVVGEKARWWWWK